MPMQTFSFAKEDEQMTVCAGTDVWIVMKSYYG